jgi:hypothetical protein
MYKRNLSINICIKLILYLKNCILQVLHLIQFISALRLQRGYIREHINFTGVTFFTWVSPKLVKSRRNSPKFWRSHQEETTQIQVNTITFKLHRNVSKCPNREFHACCLI